MVPSFAPTTSPTLSELPSLSVSPSLSPSDEPTLPPTSEPSASPSVGPSSSPSAAPTTAPSAPPTGSPTAESPSSDSIQGMFDYDIIPFGEVTVQFSQGTANQEVVIYYRISQRATEVRVYQDGCQTLVNQSLVEIIPTILPYNDTHDTLKVALDVKLDSVVNSSIFNIQCPETGLLSLCTRVDLKSPLGTPVVFHEQMLYATINLVNDFAVTTIDLERLDPQNVTTNGTLDYALFACQCNVDNNHACEAPVLPQNSIVSLCLWTNVTNIEIASVRSLVLKQEQQDGDVFVRAITGGNASDLTNVVFPNNDGKLAVITTRLISTFFDEQDPEDVIASGTCALIFTDDEGVSRHLRAPIRELQDEKIEDSEYEVFIQLGSADELQLSSASASFGPNALATAGAAAVVSLLL